MKVRYLEVGYCNNYENFKTELAPYFCALYDIPETEVYHESENVLHGKFILYKYRESGEIMFNVISVK